MIDPYVGKLTFARVYSGRLKSGSYVYNSTKERRERVGRILRMHANHREDISEIATGDIVAIVGLKSTNTGDTLCDENAPIILENISFPEPVIDVAIEPKTKADQEKMSLSLAKLSEEDPTFRTRTDEETGQTIISGMGELHLEILLTGCSGSLKSALMWANLKLLTKKPFGKKCGLRAGLSARPVGAASMDIVGWNWNPWSRGRVIYLKIKLSAVQYPKSIYRPLMPASGRP